MSDQLAVIALALAGAGVAMAFRRAWSDLERVRWDMRTLASAIGIVALVAASWTIGPALGIAFAVVILPIGGLAVVLASPSRRAARSIRFTQLAPEPLAGPSRA